MLALQDAANSTLSFPTQSLLADLLGLFSSDTVPRELKLTSRGFSDFLRAVRRLVVDNEVSAQRAEIFEVAWRGGGDDSETRGFGELDTNNASCRAAAVNEDWVGLGGGLSWQRELQKLIKSLALHMVC